MINVHTTQRVAIITGAAGGIGSAVARALGRDGCAIVLVDRAEADLEPLRRELEAASIAAVAVKCDTRDSSDVDRAAAEAAAHWGGIDAVVTCAGVGQIVPLEQTTDEIWHDAIATNLSGTFWWARATVPHLRRRGSGVIVMVSSTTALVGLPGRAAYAASKAGVLGLAKTLAIEYAAEGIRVVPVCPGATLTGLVRQGYENSPDPAAAEREHARLQPIGRLSTPEEIAEAIAFACSTRAATITGSTIVVDGGYSSGGISWST